MENIIIGRIKQGNLYFSILSLILSSLLLIIIYFNTKLSQFSYSFLKWILVSEVLNSIGNIVQSTTENKLLILIFISFSDIFTNLLFSFFSYSSLQLIKETNRLIKNKVNFFILTSFVISILYCIIFFVIGLFDKKYNTIDLRFSNYYYKGSKENEQFSKILYFFHLLLYIIHMKS